MKLRQVEVHKNNEHIANLPIQEATGLSFTRATNGIGYATVPFSIQCEIGKMLRRGWEFGYIGDFFWKVKVD